MPIQDLGGSSVRFDDLMGGVGFDRERSDLDARGLDLDMPAWGYHVFGVAALDEAQVEGRRPAQVSSDRVLAVQTRESRGASSRRS